MNSRTQNKGISRQVKVGSKAKHTDLISTMRPIIFTLFASVILAGCSTLTKPEDLQTPAIPSCVNLPVAISFNEKVYGYPWETRLEKGPYISEKEGPDGVYFRGPPGALSLMRSDLKDQPINQATHRVSDGGFFLPHDPKSPPRLYSYFSASNAERPANLDGVSCATLAYVSSPSNSNISVVDTAIQGAVGATAGRANAIGSGNVSYGQAAIGGAIAGALISTIINNEVGKISMWDPLKDAAFIAQLNAVRSHTALINKLEKPRSDETSDTKAEKN